MATPLPHIVLVDPFGDEREMYAEFLTHSGFFVSAFDTPDAALASARSLRPQLVVTRMRQDKGQINGIALTRALRSDPQTEKIPVLIITTSIFQHDRDAAEAAGSDGYLLLPATPSDLLAEMRRILLHARHTSARNE